MLGLHIDFTISAVKDFAEVHCSGVIRFPFSRIAIVSDETWLHWHWLGRLPCLGAVSSTKFTTNDKSKIWGTIPRIGLSYCESITFVSVTEICKTVHKLESLLCFFPTSYNFSHYFTLQWKSCLSKIWCLAQSFSLKETITTKIFFS